jgi:hypothetical protein
MWMLEVQGGSTRSHPAENSLWNGLWTCCYKTDNGMNEWMNEWMCTIIGSLWNKFSSRSFPVAHVHVGRINNSPRLDPSPN